MTNRREVLSGGIAVCALTAGRVSAAVGAGSGVMAPESAAPAPSMLIYDRTLAPARAFGAAAAGNGARTAGVGADLGSAWMHLIEPAWRAGPGVLAGMTAAAPLFCLEFLGRDYGMHVVYRIGHEPLGADAYRHWPSRGDALADDPLAGAADLLAAAGPRWPATAAELAARSLSALKPDFPYRGMPLLELEAEPAGAPPRLFTWLMAPAGGAATRRAPLGVPT